jgi:hypothetical protein
MFNFAKTGNLYQKRQGVQKNKSSKILYLRLPLGKNNVRDVKWGIALSNLTVSRKNKILATPSRW